jgi:hypothetical protein
MQKGPPFWGDRHPIGTRDEGDARRELNFAGVGASSYLATETRCIFVEGAPSCLKWAKDYDMSKMERIEFLLAAVPRGLSSVATSMFQPKQPSMRRSESPPFDGDRKVIAFPVQDISFRQAPGLRNRDATGDAKFRRRRHAALSSKRTAKSHEENSGKSKAATRNDDNHSHRMIENFFGAAVLILLVIAGNWILSTLVKMP